MSTPTRTRAFPAEMGSSAPHMPASTPLERFGNGHLDTQAREMHKKPAKHGANTPQDAHTTTARGVTAIRRPKLNLWEKQLIDNPEVRRKATIAQLCMQTPSHPSFQPRSNLNDRLLRLLLFRPLLSRLTQRTPCKIRRRHLLTLLAACRRGLYKGAQVLFGARTRAPAQEANKDQSAPVPHHRANRPGRIWRGLPRSQARQRGSVRIEEDAQGDVDQDGRSTARPH